MLGPQLTQACFLPEAADFIVKTTEECRRLSLPLSKHAYTLGLQALAKELGVTVSVGIHDVPEEGDDDEPDSLRVYNTHVLIDKEGSIKARYSKVGYLIDAADGSCTSTTSSSSRMTGR